MHLSRKVTAAAVCIIIVAGSDISHASPAELQLKLEALTGNLSDDAGIQITSLDTKKTFFRKNSQTPLNPASVTKLVTTAAALKYLGPEYKFHTRFYTSGDNDLFIEGGGDPSFVIEELISVADQLVRKGIKNIRNIIIDDSLFQDYTSPGLPGRKSYGNPYTGALSLNFNQIGVYVTPSGRAGEKAKVRADAGGIDIDIENKVITKRKGGNYITFEPPRGDDGDVFTVSGHVRAGGKTRRYEYRVSLPPLYFAEALKALLVQRNSRVTGSFYSGARPQGARLILDHESKPLAEILKDMNKFSNNFTAEQLVKVLGAKSSGSPGTTKNGIAAFRKYLDSLGIDQRSYQLVNGSGLTYENRMSAEQIVRIIQDIYDDKRLWPAFYNSLCIGGRDGTLKRRFRSGPTYNKLRAKTGTVEGVRTIAGVVPARNGHEIGFAILLNGSKNIRGYRQLQEKVAETIADLSFF